MSATLDTPTRTVCDGIAVEHCPESSTPFFAYFDGHRNAVCGFGSCESEAIDDLHAAVEAWEEIQRDKRHAAQLRYGWMSGE